MEAGKENFSKKSNLELTDCLPSHVIFWRILFCPEIIPYNWRFYLLKLSSVGSF